jgi:hypothetical protein
LAGAAVLVAAVEALVAGHSLDLTRQDNWEWRLSGRASIREAPGAGVLAFGSSVVRLGVIPRVIEPAVGTPVYNLGLCAGPPPASYFLLRRALEAGARPAFVLVEFHPLTLTRDAWHTAAFWPDLLSTRETLELAVAARDARFAGAMTLARFLPSLKDRYEIRARVLAALKGEHKETRTGVLSLLRNVRQNSGALVIPSRGDAERQGPRAEEVTLRPGSWTPSALYESYVQKFFKLARRHGVRVVWIIPPVSPALQALREANGTDAGYHEFARREAARHPGVIVLDGTRSGLEGMAFFDSEHLDRGGASRWSAALAAALRDLSEGRFGADHWVKADIPRAAGAGDGVEDYAQSLRAVGQIIATGSAPLRR